MGQSHSTYIKNLKSMPPGFILTLLGEYKTYDQKVFNFTVFINNYYFL